MLTSRVAFAIVAAMASLWELRAVPASANDFQAIIQQAHGHYFVSAPMRIGQVEGLSFEICNDSQTSSGVYWPAAGFGVGAPGKLMPGLCARYKNFSGPNYSRADAEVIFQDGGRGYINSWRYCDRFSVGIDACGQDTSSQVYRFISELTIFAAQPDEVNVALQEVRIAVDRYDKSSMYLDVLTSSSVSRVSLAFPEGRLSEVQDGFSSFSAEKAKFYAAPLSSFVKAGPEHTDSLLANNLSPDTPAIVFDRVNETDGISGYVKGLDVKSIGPRIVILVLSDQGILARGDFAVAD